MYSKCCLRHRIYQRLQWTPALPSSVAVGRTCLALHVVSHSNYRPSASLVSGNTTPHLCLDESRNASLAVLLYHSLCNSILFLNARSLSDQQRRSMSSRIGGRIRGNLCLWLLAASTERILHMFRRRNDPKQHASFRSPTLGDFSSP
jgi:hypothetical protein